MNFNSKSDILILSTKILLIILFIIILFQTIIPGISKDMLSKQILIEQENTLKEAGIKYFTDTPKEIPTYTNELKYISVAQLIKLGYLDEVVDNEGNICDYNFSRVSIRKIGENEYNYYPDLLCGDYATYKTWSDWTSWNKTPIENKETITDVEKMYYYDYETAETKKTEWTSWIDTSDEQLTFSSDKEVEYKTLYSYQDKQWIWFNTKGNDYADGYYIIPPDGYSYKDKEKYITEYKYATNVSEICSDDYYDDGTDLNGYSINKDNSQIIYQYTKQEVIGTEFNNCGGWAKSEIIAKSSCPNNCDKIIKIENPNGLYSGTLGYQCQAEEDEYNTIKYNAGNWTTKIPKEMNTWTIANSKTQYKYCKTLEYVVDKDETKYANGYFEKGKGPDGYIIDKTKNIVEYIWIKPTSSKTEVCKTSTYFTNQETASKQDCTINKNETIPYRCFSYKTCNGLSDSQCKVNGTTKTTCYANSTIGTHKETIDAYDALAANIGRCYSIPSVYYHKTEEYGYIKSMYFNGLVYQAVDIDDNSKLCLGYGKYLRTEAKANAYGCTILPGAASHPMRCFTYNSCGNLSCEACKTKGTHDSLCFSDGVSGPGTIYTKPYDTLYSATKNNTCTRIPKVSYDSGTSKACNFQMYYTGVAYKAYTDDSLGKGERYPETGWTKETKDDSWIKQDSRILYKYYKTVQVANTGESSEWTTTKLDNKHTVLETRKKYAYYTPGEEKIYNDNYSVTAPVGYPYKDENNYAMSTLNEWTTKKPEKSENRITFSKQQYKTRNIYLEWTKINTQPLTKTEFKKTIKKDFDTIKDDPYIRYTTIENYKYRSRNVSKFASMYVDNNSSWWLDTFIKLILTVCLSLITFSNLKIKNPWIINSIIILLSSIQIIFNIAIWNYIIWLEIIIIVLNIAIILFNHFFTTKRG